MPKAEQDRGYERRGKKDDLPNRDGSSGVECHLDGNERNEVEDGRLNARMINVEMKRSAQWNAKENGGGARSYTR